MSSKSKNDLAWETLFQRHHILAEVDRHGVYEISSAQINREREARLATKFDHRRQLPEVFRRHHLTIQPNTRGTYLVGRFESYQDLPDAPVPVEGVAFPDDIETISPTNLYSESAVLLCAFHTGIMRRLLNEEVSLTVFGRMSSGSFDYSIRNPQTGAVHDIQVEGSQLEIDGGFEGGSVLAIVEAKNQIVDDFLVRQLYYPYRLWAGKTSKRVIPVFLSYSNANSVFSFYVFRFAEPTLYNSIELVEQKKYRIVPSDIGPADIRDALRRARVGPEPAGVPFPQADSFARVIDLLTQLYGSEGPLSQDYITTNYAFDLRQTQYYTQAANYLGLVEGRRDARQSTTYALTRRGAEIMGMHPNARNLALVECIFERRVFKRTFRLYLERGERPTREQVIEIMKEEGVRLAGTTLPRRAQTVLAWVDWIIQLTRQS